MFLYFILAVIKICSLKLIMYFLYMLFVLYSTINYVIVLEIFNNPLEEYAFSSLDAPLVEKPDSVKLNYHISLSSKGDGTQNDPGLTGGQPSMSGPQLTGGQLPNNGTINDPNLNGGQFPNNGTHFTGGEGSRPSLFKPD
jgi:hypothetical protein